MILGGQNEEHEEEEEEGGRGGAGGGGGGGRRRRRREKKFSERTSQEQRLHCGLRTTTQTHKFEIFQIETHNLPPKFIPINYKNQHSAQTQPPQLPQSIKNSRL